MTYFFSLETLRKYLLFTHDILNYLYVIFLSMALTFIVLSTLLVVIIWSVYFCYTVLVISLPFSLFL